MEETKKSTDIVVGTVCKLGIVAGDIKCQRCKYNRFYNHYIVDCTLTDEIEGDYEQDFIYK